MNGELLGIIDSIERDKGIDRETLIQAVEAALLSAFRKSTGEVKNITINIERNSGAIKIFRGRKEIKKRSFGRIAAQTAKQVIIQRIREAERESIYDEFKKKVGGIVNGTVHRFERGDIIVNLGKTEAILPKREQCRKERYRQGDRIRSYILEVKKSNRGPQIILSRSYPLFIKELFELEVPEIYEKVIEVKSVCREAGDRTKIAVRSTDEKVDPVGACVGVRGQRVKNVIREIGEEKIDIVRWSDDIKTYITNALSPAEILSIKINKDEQKAEVLVNDDQLSLAIGKRGQNVRLAAKLTGWKIDIRGQAEIIPLSSLEGVGPKTEKALIEAGYKTLRDVVKSDLANLRKIKGIGKKTAEKIYQSAKKLTEKGTG
jgi:N utilization substance protein A